MENRNREINMADYDHLPLYNLKAVLQETGLKAELLRAWERRYSLPNPQRTSGGHRLYSDYDIAVIKWLHLRQAEGLSISRAVELWKEITHSGQDPLLNYSPTQIKENSSVTTDQSQIGNLRNDWLRACMNFDGTGADDVINRALAMYPIETVCFELILAGLREVGSSWVQGVVSVQQEHFTTNLAKRRIETLIALTPLPVREQTIILGCPENEWHTFPVLLLNLLLRRKGFNVIYLGASIPLEQLQQTAAQIKPALVILGAQRINAVPSLRSAAKLFQEMEIRFGYGGLIFNRIPRLQNLIPAIFLGENLENATDTIESILSKPFVAITRAEEHSEFVESARVLRSKLFLIEARVLDQLTTSRETNPSLNEINEFFASGLTAALEIGDPSYLEPDLEWVKRLLESRNIPPIRIDQYLEVYLSALKLEIGDASLPIMNWLVTYLSKNK